MASRRAQTEIILLPSREWLQRFSRIVLVGAGLTLLIMSKTGNPVAMQLRTNILDVVTPVIAVAASPFEVVSDMGRWMGGVASMHAENIALKNENIQLLQWQQAAKQMEAENQSLKTLLNVVPAKKTSYVTVRIVSDFGGPYAQSALINGGAEQNIKKDQPIISDNGLVGRVVEVGKTSSRVLLLGDINSRIPVIAERSRDRGILTGNNNSLPHLSYLPANNSLEVGDRIITSGDGGMFPAGLPVGVVTSSEAGVVAVQPFADISRVEYVSAIDYSF